MTALSQNIPRQHYYDLVAANLVGAGKELVAAYDHVPSSFDGQSPVALVLRGGVAREYQGVGTSLFYNEVYMIIQIYVAAADAESGITTEQVDDELDNVEQAFADLTADNHKYVDGVWVELKYNGEPSLVADVLYQDGTPYKMEEFILIAEAPDVAI